MATSTATLFSINDTGFVLANPDEDIRGYQVVDAAGEDVGHVDDLLVDKDQAKVRFLRVASGGFLGIGETTFLIPVDVISKIEKDRVFIDQSRVKIGNAPVYVPELVDQVYLNQLYGHYDRPPYWSDGYSYPGYPYVW